MNNGNNVMQKCKKIIIIKPRAETKKEFKIVILPKLYTYANRQQVKKITHLPSPMIVYIIVYMYII